MHEVIDADPSIPSCHPHPSSSSTYTHRSSSAHEDSNYNQSEASQDADYVAPSLNTHHHRRGMGGVADVYLFLVDNVLGAVLGVVWGYVCPFYTSSDEYSYIAAAFNDVVATTVMCIVTYYLVKR